MFMLCSVDKQVPLLSQSQGASHGVFHSNNGATVSQNFTKRAPLDVPSFSGWKGSCFSKYNKALRWERLQTCVAYDVAGAVEVINDLGLDTLTFLAVTVLIVPTFKSIKASPVRSSWCSTAFFFFCLYDNLISHISIIIIIIIII